MSGLIADRQRGHYVARMDQEIAEARDQASRRDEERIGDDQGVVALDHPRRDRRRLFRVVVGELDVLLAPKQHFALPTGVPLLDRRVIEPGEKDGDH